MSIAVIGAGGQLGTELLSCLSGEVIPLGHAEIELTDPSGVEAALAAASPRIVINAAAYNFVDQAEDEPDAAFAVNALGPRNLARYCGPRDVALLHVSTDYVFSGRICIDGLDAVRSVPYSESDRPEPLSAYGVSKLAGEQFVKGLCPKHFIVRTCGLYGRTRSRGKGNFVETMLRLGRERDELKVVNDQRCTPTATTDLARAIAALLETEAYGLYHATNSGSTTWYEFAREILRLADIDIPLRPISTAEFGAKARRPPFSVLDCSKLAAATGIQMPPWQQALAQYLSGSSR